MRWLNRARVSFLMLFRRGTEKSRLNREFEFHLEQQIVDNVSLGMDLELAGRHLAGSAVWLAHVAEDSRILPNRNIGNRSRNRRHRFAVYRRPISVAPALAIPGPGQTGDAVRALPRSQGLLQRG